MSSNSGGLERIQPLMSFIEANKIKEKTTISHSALFVLDLDFVSTDHDAWQSAVRPRWAFLVVMCLCFSDLARERNLKNQKGKGQSAADTEANKGLSLQERQARDAAKWEEHQRHTERLETIWLFFRMREKQQLAAEKRSGGNKDGPGGDGGAASGGAAAASARWE